MKVRVLGSGAREHALVRSLAADPAVTELHAAPGNAGIAADATVHRLDLGDTAAAVSLAKALGVDLVVVGPEQPLVLGVADRLRDAGITTFGPSQEAAALEGSKAFAKDVMSAAEVPTALAHVCTTPAEVADALDAFGAPYVVKDDGLAAGKGVVVTDDREAALAHAAECLAKEVAPGVVNQVVVEEFLDGPEVSLFCLSDGVDVLPLAPAQDFKRIFDGDAGPNTGGMGAYTPLDWAPDDLTEQVLERVARPTVAELARRGTPFVGLLYCGLALTSRGLRVIEFNARFGDPETQVVLARLDTPLDRALHAAATGALAELGALRRNEDAAVTVVLATPGYPERAITGGAITGIEDAEAVDGAWVLHAGTALDGDGRLVAAGGRVLSVVGTGATLAQARAVAYDAAGRISLEGGQVRTDIALRAERGEVTVPGPRAAG